MKNEMPLKLNLACGNIILKGWVNIDLYDPHADVKGDITKLDYKDNTVDEIYASHIIEHFHFYEAFDVLKEWCRVLKPGGKIMIETPDMLASCKLFVEGNEQERVGLYGHMFGQPWLPGQTHKMLYTETQLRWTLDQSGFENMRRVLAYAYGNPGRNLGIEAYKRPLPMNTALPLTQILSFELGTDCNLSKIHKLCPNKEMKRGKKKLTDDIIIASVIDAYTNLGFEGLIGWSFYNEPMLHYKRMFDLMEKIRKAVPKSRFILWTNGTILVEDERMKMFEIIYVTNYLNKSVAELQKHFAPHVKILFEPKLDDRLNHYGEPNKKSCTLPFDCLAFGNTGEAYICCLDWKNEVKIGNIFDSNLKAIDVKRWSVIKNVSGKEMKDSSPKACLGCKHKWDVCHFDSTIRTRALYEIGRWI